MKIKHQWTAPDGVRNNKGTDYQFHRMGQELVFPMLTDNSTENTPSDAVTRVRFALWLVNPQTMTERLIEAPFYLEQGHNWLSQYRFRAETQENGEMIFSLLQKGSYEYHYTLFSFDGSVWRQTLFNKKSQHLVYGEQEFKVWDEPGNAVISPPLLSGGDLAVCRKPLTFAADYTHAFSYDSGPDTPQSDAYLDAQQRSKRNPAKVCGFDAIPIVRYAQMIACLPDDHPARESDAQYFRGMTVGDDLLVMHSPTYQGLGSLFLIGA